MIPKSVDPFRGNDVLEPSGDRVYPIPLTPFPFDPPLQKHALFAKSHVLFGANRHNGHKVRAPAGLHVPFGSIFVIGAKAPVTLQFSPWTLWLEPKSPVSFGLNSANAHCGSWGKRVRDFLRNARTLWPEQHFSCTLWLEFGKRPLQQWGPKST